MTSAPKRGVRLAPSPTGQFHVGNLRTAYLSYLWAKTLGEPWVVRFEDIDTPRVLPEARQNQLSDLLQLGLRPDEVLVQSDRKKRHWELFEKARQSGQVYPCTCSRKEVLQALASAPHSEGALYSGHCRDEDARKRPSKPEERRDLGWRFKHADPARDVLVARTVSESPDLESFVPSYPWACAIDDWDGNYSLLVRAWDLAHALDAQRAIQGWVAQQQGQMEWVPPAVFHTSLVTANDGTRLEKRTQGVTLREWIQSGRTVEQLIHCFQASIKKANWDVSSVVPGRVFGETQKSLKLNELGMIE